MFLEFENWQLHPSEIFIAILREQKKSTSRKMKFENSEFFPPRSEARANGYSI